MVPARGKGEAVAARELRVLVDTEATTSWKTWNGFARDFAEGERRPDRGGRRRRDRRPGLHRHCQRLKAPVLQGPKRDPAPLPAGLRTRRVIAPTPLWSWSLVTRADDDRPAVLTLRENADSLSRAAGLRVLPNRDWGSRRRTRTARRSPP